MKARPLWIDRIENAWAKRSIVWLSGVRRVGKTTLAKMLSPTVYMNCDLPSVVRQLKDPESFFDSLSDGDRIVFDEIHQLDEPTRLLKVAADAYPHLKILATGSSTLAATRKFRDTLTGRKTVIYLAPVLWNEAKTVFGVHDLDRRLLQGGLPELLLESVNETEFFSDWIAGFYARDILELFSIRDRTGFLKLMRFLLRQSAGMLEYTSLAKHSGLSRHTVKAHIEAMSIAHAVFLLPPFHGGARRELTHRPKAYAFDTGFVAFEKGWHDIRDEDRGLLWEHLTLDALRFRHQGNTIFYWADKSGREIDFVCKRARGLVDAFECKIDPDRFTPDSLQIFRGFYPEGDNYVVSPYVKTTFQRRFNDLLVQFISVEELMRLNDTPEET